MGKDKDSKDAKIVDEQDPEPPDGGAWFWGGEPPPANQPLARDDEPKAKSQGR